jgi:hypothetical protein
MPRDHRFEARYTELYFLSDISRPAQPSTLNPKPYNKKPLSPKPTKTEVLNMAATDISRHQSTNASV